MTSEHERATELLLAQAKASAFFDRIAMTLIRPGIRESQLVREIAALGKSEFDLQQNWHKRIVRAGPNTLAPYDENPPDLVVGEDDLVFIDLGPVFEAWEADFGRTYVLGDDPHKRRLCADAEAAFHAGKQYFQARPDITGSELLAHVSALATAGGWTFGGTIAGHLVGEFPHKTLPENRAVGYADVNHHVPMRGLDSLGRQRHWILEIHFVDRERRIGAFFEELLTLDPPSPTAGA